MIKLVGLHSAKKTFDPDARLELLAMARRAGCKLFIAFGSVSSPDVTPADFAEWTKNAKSRENFSQKF